MRKPINKLSAMGISYSEPQVIEKKLSRIEIIQCHFEQLENSIHIAIKTKSKKIRLLAPVQIYEIKKSINKSNKNNNLKKNDIDFLIKNEIRRRENIVSLGIIELTNKSIVKKISEILPLIRQEINIDERLEVLLSICGEHIKIIEEMSWVNKAIIAYVDEVKTYLKSP